jgi:hypothetical protein
MLPLLGGAKEQVECLREDQRMLVALDEDGLKGGVDIGAMITAPGPTGIPAARSARAKPTTLSAIRPDDGGMVSTAICLLEIC